MKKLIWTLVIVAVVAIFGGRAVYLHQQVQAESSNEKIIKIGAILPLTSIIAHEGQTTLESLKIAEKNINNNSKYNFHVKILVEDGKYTPKDSLSAFQKLSANNINALIILGERPLGAITKFVDENKIPTMAIAGKTNLNSLSPYFFKVPMTTTVLTSAFGTYAVNQMNLKNIGALYVDMESGRDPAMAFIEAAQKQNANITGIEKYKQDALDVKAQVLKIVNTNPDGILLIGFGDKSFPACINYIRELGYQKPILSFFSVPSVLDKLKDTSNIYFVDVLLQDNFETNTYKKEFAAKFQGAEPDWTPTFSYIAENIIAEVAQKVDINNAEVFMKELKSGQSFNTPYGKLDIINEETYVPMYVKKVLPNGTIEVVDEIK